MMRLALAASLLMASCGGLTVTGLDGGVGDIEAQPPAPGRVDLLLVVDNSGSMAQNQVMLASQLDSLVDALLNPQDRNGDGRPDHAPVRDVHVGVVSTDMGATGGLLVDCSGRGDDGLLNPRVRGPASSAREPVRIPGFRPPDCSMGDGVPAFLSYRSEGATPAVVSHDARCDLTLSSFGCGIEQPLEAAYRAIVWRRADDAPDNSGANAGFVRRDALLVIVVLSDEDDGSVRDCAFAERPSPGAPEVCVDAADVFDASSSAWGSADLNLRFYLYRPCGPRDPTWPLDRYVDPARPTRGFLGLKPGHPERVIFAAVTGVPLDVPTRGDWVDRAIDWSALLGRPAPSGADDFCGRSDETALTLMTREGPISMRQGYTDPLCPSRVMPACRRAGSEFAGTCDPAAQYTAWPARRLVEVARRFDDAPMCAGQPCRNGMVSSICASDFRGAMTGLVERVQRRLPN